jgi:hypothetical protein
MIPSTVRQPRRTSPVSRFFAALPAAAAVATVLAFSSCSQLLLEAENASSRVIAPQMSMSVPNTLGGVSTLVFIDSNRDGTIDGADVDGDGSGDFAIFFDKDRSEYYTDINLDGFREGHFSMDPAGSISFTTLSGGRGRDVELHFAPDFQGFNLDADTGLEALLPGIDFIPPSVAINAITASAEDRTAELTWDQATDNLSAVSEISYQVYISLNDIPTLPLIDSAVAAETAIAFGSPQYAVSGTSLFGLEVGMTYFVNVVARDAAGNRMAYASTSFTTVYPYPYPMVDTVITAQPSNTGDPYVPSDIFLYWNPATDDQTPGNLTYRVFYSEYPNIDSWENMQNNGIEVPNSPQGNVSSWAVLGEWLEFDTTYWFNVAVFDPDGNYLEYQQVRTFTAAYEHLDSTFIWDIDEFAFYNVQMESLYLPGMIYDDPISAINIGWGNDRYASPSGALLLDGVGAYVETQIGANEATPEERTVFSDEFTITFWMLSTPTAGEENIMYLDMDNADSGPENLFFSIRHVNGGRVRVIVGNRDIPSNFWVLESIGPVPVDDSIWHSVVFVRRTDRIELYIDGLLAASLDDTALTYQVYRPDEAPPDVTSNIVFGKGWDGGDYYAGGLDRVTIDNFAFTERQALQLHRYFTW